MPRGTTTTPSKCIPAHKRTVVEALRRRLEVPNRRPGPALLPPSLPPRRHAHPPNRTSKPFAARSPSVPVLPGRLELPDLPGRPARPASSEPRPSCRSGRDVWRKLGQLDGVDRLDGNLFRSDPEVHQWWCDHHAGRQRRPRSQGLRLPRRLVLRRVGRLRRFRSVLSGRACLTTGPARRSLRTRSALRRTR